jgi:hypothetical protein
MTELADWLDAPSETHSHLVAADILEPVGRTRARYYREGPRFPEVALTEARTPMPVSNPYTG